ncbi:MAG: peptide/nickel transport system substrate-binding protein [Candidatus Eremiobacteraeota bacterium]|nr:peptide/nickel transport system substrate-binding protein [Candidatus Eremiobacteraeota bacterium]
MLRYATAEDIVGLNPHLTQQTVLSYMAQMTMAWLTKYDVHNRPIPELSTEVPSRENGGISKDGLTITYHLRKGVKWSDGQPFTADDVVFSTKVVLNPANNEVGRDGWDLITKIDEPDKYTVVYHLRKQYAPFAATFFSTGGANPCVLPKHLLANLPNINHAPYNALPVGIGPFKYKSWKRSDSVELVPDPLYFRGQPKLQRIVFKIVPDRNTVTTQLETHEIDLWTPVSPAYYDRVRSIPGVVVDKNPGYYFGHLDLQNTHPGLDDPRVRRALRLATDREQIKMKIRHGLGLVQDNPVSPANPAFDKSVPTDPYDPAQAAKLLDQAGWKPGPDGIRTKNGHALNLVFATSTGTPDTDSMIELIRAEWKNVGVGLSVKRYPSPLMFAPYADGGIVYGGKWDVITFNWGGDPIGDLSSLYECKSIPPNGQNDPRYCNKTVSAAMEKFKLEYDEKKRQQYSHVIQSGIAQDTPIIVLDIVEDIFAHNSDLKGFHPNQLSPFDDMMNVDI